MKILSVTDDAIQFYNGDRITFFHGQDCCEENYADFKQLDNVARSTEFELPIVFESVNNYGFRFGNKPDKMFFVPCYSDQNGYYSDEIEIEYNGDTVLTFDCEEICDY